MAKKKLTFEQGLARLEEIINEIENSDRTLEETVKLYKEGVSLSLLCEERLQAAEKEITLLQRTADGLFVQKSFEISGNEESF